MRYQVPKFLERESKFFNLFTFKQLVTLGVIGVVMFILYYILPKTGFFVILVMVGAAVFAFAFVKIEGFSLGQVIMQSFSFFSSSKKYYWQKNNNGGSPTLIQKKVEVKKEEEEPLKLAPQGRIGKLSSNLEMGLRREE